ncbi:hypothetical protein, partial [Endozoicomonas sp. ONNA2]|uniref:hypothetical protein n=1 Tax=Endozoicomonas sp. ONNA2 TaxID=2828741 RepID=UPI0021489083
MATPSDLSHTPDEKRLTAGRYPPPLSTGLSGESTTTKTQHLTTGQIHSRGSVVVNNNEDSGKTALSEQPQGASTQQGKTSVRSSLSTSATDGSLLKPGSVTADATKLTGQPS